MKHSTRSLLLLVALVAVAGVLVIAFPGFSSASLSARTQATATVRAAVDWTPPTVAVVSPGNAVKATATIAMTAADGETGIASVTLERLAPGASGWVGVCTDTVAPYSCAWNTLPLADGEYGLRARASDNAGHETVSDTMRTSVVNTLRVILASPGAAVRGAVPLATTVDNAAGVTHTVRVEYAPTGTTTWTTICTGLSSPYACSWDTTAGTAGSYDLRSVLTAGSTTTTSSVVTAVTVDNVAPTVTMLDPGTPLSGTRTFAATATDPNSGVARVVFQYALTSTATWQNLCTVTGQPWSCSVATSSIPDGSYSFRAIATDLAGNSTTSAPVANRVVDNTVSSITVDAPSTLSGTVTVTAAASSTAGVASVRIQATPTGSSTWSDLCTDTTSPYACTWDTTTVADGRYDVRGILLDSKGRTTTSAVVASRLVDNAPLGGVDVQSSNGGGSIGGTDDGDTLTLTYSRQIDLSRVLSGWDGTNRTVTVRLRDGDSLGLTNTDDTLDVLNGGAAVNLGSVNLRGNFVHTSTVQFTATMTAGTVTTSSGVVRSTVTLRLGAVSSGNSNHVRISSTTGAMVWTPSSAVTDLRGRPCSTTPVTETGTSDRDF